MSLAISSLAICDLISLTNGLTKQPKEASSRSFSKIENIVRIFFSHFQLILKYKGESKDTALLLNV